jgi:hypothetical protein
MADVVASRLVVGPWRVEKGVVLLDAVRAKLP